MKLNINAKELLALYNLLKQLPEEEALGGDLQHLRQVHDRIRSIILGSLSNKPEQDDMFETWAKQQQTKIDKLNEQNEQLVPVNALADIMSDDENEVMSDLPYPKHKKGPPSPQMPFGKHKGKKR